MAIISIDGVNILIQSAVILEINGKAPQRQRIITCRLHGVHWDYGDDGFTYVSHPLRVKTRKHTIYSNNLSLLLVMDICPQMKSGLRIHQFRAMVQDRIKHRTL